MSIDHDDDAGGGSMALVPYQRMDAWELVLQRHGERRESAIAASSLPCEKKQKWAFTVRLVSEEGDRWPDQRFTFRVDLTGGGGAIHAVDPRAGGRMELHVDGEGPDHGSTSCDVRGWDVTAAPEVTLPDDDGKTFEVKIRARWIDLRVRYHDRDTVVPGVTLKLTVPDAVVAQPITAQETLHVEREFTKLGTVAVKEMSLAEGVWEYVP